MRGLRALLLVPALLAAIIVEPLVLRLSGGVRIVDPFLVVAVAFAVRGGESKRRALLCGGLAGLVQDFLASGVFGVHYLAKLVVAYVASLVSGRLIPGQPLTAGVLVGGGALLEQVVVLLLGGLLGSAFRVQGFGELVLCLIGNIVAGLLVFWVLDRVGRGRRPGQGSPRGR
jgi:rod shape-determining protein MreD